MSTLVLTVNVVGIGPEATQQGENALFGRFAHGRYTQNVGLDRLLTFLSARRVRATFFWPATEAARMPSQIARCTVEGHEVASMGWGFEDHTALQPEKELELLTRSHEQLQHFSGQRPIGFRAPNYELSRTTLFALSQLGYRYDSSFVDDDHPYNLRDYDVPRLLELPYAEGLHDAHYFSLRMPQSRVEAMMRETFDASQDTVGWSCITITPRGDNGVGRLARLEMLGRLLDHAEKRGSRIATASEALRDFDTAIE